MSQINKLSYRCHGPSSSIRQLETVEYHHTSLHTFAGCNCANTNKNTASESNRILGRLLPQLQLISKQKVLEILPWPFALFLFRHPNHASYTSRNSKNHTCQHVIQILHLHFKDTNNRGHINDVDTNAGRRHSRPATCTHTLYIYISSTTITVRGHKNDVHTNAGRLQDCSMYAY
jgi:hypothetical protein